MGRQINDSRTFWFPELMLGLIARVTHKSLRDFDAEISKNNIQKLPNIEPSHRFNDIPLGILKHITQRLLNDETLMPR
jgi:hypothetical protein